MPGPKTDERPGTRAVLRYAKVSAFKVREVLDLIRGRPVREAADLLRFVERDTAVLVEKLLHSAVSNAANNDSQDADELYVSACYADEGPTSKRWRHRARGRTSRIRKRSSHVTVVVTRLPEERLARLQTRRRAENLAMRARRVEATRRARAQAAEGTTRRERRHPGAAPAEAPTGEEAVAPEDVATGEEAVAPEDVATGEESVPEEEALLEEEAAAAEEAVPEEGAAAGEPPVSLAEPAEGDEAGEEGDG